MAGLEDISFGFNVPCFSDTQLVAVVRAPCSPRLAPAAELQSGKEPALKLLVSRLALAAASPVFRRNIEAWQGGASGPSFSLSVTIKAGEEDTFHELIWSIYSHRTNLTSPPDLLNLMLMADLYQVDGTMALCASLLTGRPLEEVSIEEAYSYLRLPRVLRTIDHFDALADLAERRLMLAYGDLEAVWADSYMRDAFVSLPLDIVKMIIGSDQLQSAHENQVFVAVNAWIKAKMARKGDKWRGIQGVVDELAPLVRWGFVYSSLLESLVRNVAWFSKWRAGPATIKAALLFKSCLACSDVCYRGLEERLRAKFGNELGPNAKLLMPRAWQNPFGTDMPHKTMRGTFQWEVPVSSIQEALGGSRTDCCKDEAKASSEADNEAWQEVGDEPSWFMPPLAVNRRPNVLWCARDQQRTLCGITFLLGITCDDAHASDSPWTDMHLGLRFAWDVEGIGRFDLPKCSAVTHMLHSLEALRAVDGAEPEWFSSHPALTGVPQSLMAAGREEDKFFPLLFSRSAAGTSVERALTQQGFVHDGKVTIRADVSILDYNYIVS